MDIRLIALDMDGTLLDEEKQLSSANKDALNACIRRGIHIVLATGRPVSGISEVVRQIPDIRYGIFTNGANVRDFREEKVIAQELIDWELAYKVLTFLSHYPVAYDPYVNGRGKMEARFRNHLSEYGLPPAMQKLVLATRDEVPDEIEWVKNHKFPVEKINVFTPNHQLRMNLWEKLNQYSELIVTSSLHYNLEINAASATKGNALLKLAEYLGLKQEQTMAFGDGSNDLSMIQAAGIGVAMENGVESLKQQADYITASNEKNGVAAAIHHFLHLPD